MRWQLQPQPDHTESQHLPVWRRSRSFYTSHFMAERSRDLYPAKMNYVFTDDVTRMFGFPAREWGVDLTRQRLTLLFCWCSCFTNVTARLQYYITPQYVHL